MANIVFKQSLINRIILTLSERVENKNNKFLFKFVNKFDGSIHYMVSSNTSIYTNRYFEFNIKLKENPNLFNSEIALKKGEYIYYIYETEVLSIDFEDSFKKELEQGLLIVRDENIIYM